MAEETVITQYGFFDSRVKFPRQQITEERDVEDYEIELHVRGGGAVTYLGDLAIPLKNGTVVCAKPGMKRHSKLPLLCYCFHFSTVSPTLVELMDSLPFSFTAAEPDRLLPLFTESLRLDPAKRREDAVLLRSILYRILYQLALEARGAESARKSAAWAYRTALADCERYIRSNLTEKLDLRTLAQRASLSPVYFHKLFTSYFGVTPGIFVLQARIDAAKALLAGSEMDLGRIAQECGFSSQAYFTTKFRETTGQTPLAYRKTCVSRLDV